MADRHKLWWINIRSLISADDIVLRGCTNGIVTLTIRCTVISAALMLRVPCIAPGVVSDLATFFATCDRQDGRTQHGTVAFFFLFSFGVLHLLGEWRSLESSALRPPLSSLTPNYSLSLLQLLSLSVERLLLARSLWTFELGKTTQKRCCFLGPKFCDGNSDLGLSKSDQTSNVIQETTTLAKCSDPTHTHTHPHTLSSLWVD